MEDRTRAQLVAVVGEQAETILRLTRQVQDLQAQLDQLRTEVARSAAPFRRPVAQKIPPADHKKAGRRIGHVGVNRPTPDPIDPIVCVPLTCCPHCQGAVTECRDHVQFIEEIPVVKPTVTRLTTQSGVGPQCGPVATTHPLQAGRVQRGPRALALAATVNTHHGLSMRKTGHYPKSVGETAAVFVGVFGACGRGAGVASGGDRPENLVW